MKTSTDKHDGLFHRKSNNATPTSSLKRPTKPENSPDPSTYTYTHENETIIVE